MTLAVAAVPCAGENNGEESTKTGPRQAASGKDLAGASQNPVSNMVSLPFQSNSNVGIGEHNRIQEILNVQPVNAGGQGYDNAIHPDHTPYPDWELRVRFTLLFPK